MTRPIRALIDLQALRHNLGCAKRLSPGAKVMAVIKADGYGHGLERVAEVLVGAADGFGLLTVEEAVRLRDAGIDHPLCLLEGFFGAAELPMLSRYHIEAVVHHEEQLRMLEQSELSAPIRLWLKIDTGMHRIGFAGEQLSAALARLTAIPGVSSVGLMSHLANADDPSDSCTINQVEYFLATCGSLKNEKSLANSAGIIAWPTSRLQWVRPGIMLYGVSPVRDRDAAAIGLKPVMQLESRLIAVNRFRQGDVIGYGGTWVCPEDMPIGVVACGYGDGYPRHALTGTPVLVGGHRAPLVGRVSMDMITVDLRGVPEADVGRLVTLWGRDLPVELIAARAGTIAYELLCGVSGRVPRVDVGGGG